MSIKKIAEHECLDAMVAAACEQLLMALAQCQGDVFHWLLAGGGTPERCYHKLATMDVDWAKVQLWVGDERCYPLGHAERNDSMIQRSLMQAAGLSAAQLHPIRVEMGLEAAVSAYQSQLEQVPCFDMVWLGMGEDGHTASLFPGKVKRTDSRSVLSVLDSPKPPAERVSIGVPWLLTAQRVQVLVAGAGKRPIFDAICAGSNVPVSWPDADWHVCWQ